MSLVRYQTVTERITMLQQKNKKNSIKKSKECWHCTYLNAHSTANRVASQLCDYSATLRQQPTHHTEAAANSATLRQQHKIALAIGWTSMSCSFTEFRSSSIGAQRFVGETKIKSCQPKLPTQSLVQLLPLTK